jgi:iron(II)-dependent oxidoreductase
MPAPELLGQLSAAQELAYSLVESADAEACRTPYHPELSPLGWYLGYCAFLEAWWLRGEVLGEAQFSDTVRDLFNGRVPPERQGERLPGKLELLAWARRIQEDTLTRLANPAGLPEHPLLANDFLPFFLVQAYGRAYEAMVQVLTERRLGLGEADYTVTEPMQTMAPREAAEEVARGHYRVGASDPDRACDNELPPQAVQLDAYRIATWPVANGEYLAFMQAGGYTEEALWDADGRTWRGASGAHHPVHWRQDAAGHWYGVGVNGPYALTADAPLAGVNHHEARAYAAWAAAQGGALAGAVLPHEYQWEVAARLGYLKDTGRAWEWCANPFHAYAGFGARPSEDASAVFFDGRHLALRGGCLHTRPALRRASLRGWALPHQRHLFAGLRLVLPPD